MADFYNSQRVECPFCLKFISEQGKVLRCGHTFCKKCLQKYDQCTPKPKQAIVCPVCRQTTALGRNRIEGLWSKLPVNNGLHDYFNRRHVLGLVFDNQPLCTLCDTVVDESWAASHSVVYCHDCDAYMCDDCHIIHMQKVQCFLNHHVVSVSDVFNQIVHQPKQCSTHNRGKTDFYCVDCATRICRECALVKHEYHAVRTFADFHTGERRKVANLLMKSTAKRFQIEGYVCDVDKKRTQIKALVENLRTEIQDEFERKLHLLQESKRVLREKVKEMERFCETKLEEIDETFRTLSSGVSNTSELIENGNGCFEGDCLSIHTNLCSDLEELLNKRLDGSALDALLQVAQSVSFSVSGKEDICLGNVGSKQWRLDYKQDIGQSDDDNGLVPESVSVISRDHVALTYGKDRIDDFDLTNGNLRPFLETCGYVGDTTFLADGQFVVAGAEGDYRLRLCNSDKMVTNVQFTTPATVDDIVLLSHDVHDNIFAAYQKLKMIYMFTPLGGEPIKTIAISKSPLDIHATTSGSVVVMEDNGVTVYDDMGNVRCNIRKQEGALFAATDSTDTLVTACFKEKKRDKGVKGSDETSGGDSNNTDDGDGDGDNDGAEERKKAENEYVLSLERYTLDGTCIDTLLHDVQIKTTGKNDWAVLRCVAPDTIVLCISLTMYIFRNTWTHIDNMTDLHL